MAPEEAIALEARLVAIEYTLTHVAKTAYLFARLPDGQIQQAHEQIRLGLQGETFSNSNADPTLKDHFAALIAENVDRLLADFERALGEARGSRTQS